MAKKGQNHDDVILEWSLTNFSYDICTSQRNILHNLRPGIECRQTMVNYCTHLCQQRFFLIEQVR